MITQIRGPLNHSTAGHFQFSASYRRAGCSFAIVAAHPFATRNPQIDGRQGWE